MLKKANKKLRRVVITRNAYAWQYGGAEQFAYNLARSLRNEGVESVVVSRVPELLEHCRRDGIRTFRNLWLKNETHRRWMLVYYLLWPVLVGQYVWLALRSRADLLVLMSRDDQIFGTAAARLLGLPVVWFDHADMKYIVARPFRFLSKSYFEALERADWVVMISDAEREKVAVNLPERYRKRFVMINNGALKGSGKALERPAGAKIVAYVGRLERDKGLFDLVEAAPEVVRRVPDAQFWLAGKGSHELELKERVKELGLEEHFRWLGHLDNVWDLLLAADVFVYPTHHDAAPLAPVEALLAGVPVVASRIGGIPEMVPEKCGVLVTPKEPAALAGALSELLADEKRLAGMRKAAQAAGPGMEFGTVTREKYLPIFQEVVKEKA